MISVDHWYRDLVESILLAPSIRCRQSESRRLFFRSGTFNEAPLIGIRRVAWKTALREWEWFMSGSKDIRDARESVRQWWEPFSENGSVVWFSYGSQLRCFARKDSIYGYDQVAAFIKRLKDDPYSRRHVMTTWNPAEMVDPRCKLPNCHGTVIQAFVSDLDDGDRRLSLSMYQRSCDVICGLPHNLIQYWAFLMWLAHNTGCKVGDFHWIGGDVHLYREHEQLAREMTSSRGLVQIPSLVYTPTSEDFKASDFSPSGEYKPLMEHKAELVV